MKYVVVYGIIDEERDPWGGILDVDKIPKSAADKKLICAVNEALNAQKPYGNSASVDTDIYDAESMFEKLPFTGTIEREICLYIYP